MCKLNYMIAVPSRGRADKIIGSSIYKQFLATQVLNFFIRESEVHAYESEGLKVIPVNNNYNIAQKRNLMVQIANAKGFEYLFQLDDDTKLAVRREDIKNKFRPMEAAEVPEMIEEILSICSNKYPIVHPVIRMHADKKKYMYEKNVPANMFVCYHVPTLIKEGIKMDGLGQPFMEDRYTQLCLLERGYRSIAFAKYCSDGGGTNSKGGCSEYRTAQLQSESAKALKETFPDYVSLKVKMDGAWSEPRLDTIIQWKKFLSPGELPYIPKEELENK